MQQTTNTQTQQEQPISNTTTTTLKLTQYILSLAHPIMC